MPEDTVSTRLLALGRRWFERGAFDEAIELYDAARQTAEALGDAEAESRAWTGFGRAAWLSCEPKVAEHAFERAAEVARRAGDRDAALRARLRQAFMAYDSGDPDRAETILDDLEAQRLGTHEAGMALGYRGNARRSRGDLAGAVELYEQAILQLGETGGSFYAATFEMDVAIVALLEGQLQRARERLDRARTTITRPLAGHDAELATLRALREDPILPALVGHYDVIALAALGLRDLAVETKRSLAFPACAGLDFLAETHDYVLSSPEARTPAERAHELARLRADCPPYEHARLTLRVLRNLAGVDPAGANQLVVRDSPPTLRLGAEVEITLSPTSPEWRVARALVEAAERDPPASLDRDALIAAGWPGERMSDKSARNRLHVTLSSLRKRGLREVLLRHHDGYALSRAITIVRYSDSA